MMQNSRKNYKYIKNDVNLTGHCILQENILSMGYTSIKSNIWIINIPSSFTAECAVDHYVNKKIAELFVST